MRNIYRLAGILLFSMPMLGQVSFYAPSSDTQTVTQITQGDRGMLDTVDDLVREYQDKRDAAQSDLDIINNYKRLVTEDIIKEHGIKDPANMTINGSYILYNPYHYEIEWWNGANSQPVQTTPNMWGPITGSGSITY